MQAVVEPQKYLLQDSGSDEAGSAEGEPISGSRVGSEERRRQGVGSELYSFLTSLIYSFIYEYVR